MKKFDLPILIINASFLARSIDISHKTDSAGAIADEVAKANRYA
jgi:hypothetical protein